MYANHNSSSDCRRPTMYDMLNFEVTRERTCKQLFHSGSS